MKLLLILALGALCCSAARMPSMPMFEIPETAYEAEQEGNGNGGLAADAAALGSGYGEGLEALLLTSLSDLGPEPAASAATDASSNKHKAWPIRIATKFVVRPAIHGRFVEAFERFQEGSEDVKGLAHLSLNKVVGDNLVWSSFTVYEDVAALRDHLQSKAVRRFGEFIVKDNIVAQHQLLIKVGGCRSNDLTCFEAPEAPPLSAELAGGHKRHDVYPVRLITAFVVAQSRHRDFIQAWQELEADLAKAKGSLALALHKPAGDNILFLSYSAWASPEAFWAAARSESSKRFVQFLGSEGIVAVTKKLWHVGCSKAARRV